MKNLRRLGVLKALPKVWVVVLGLVLFDTAQQPLVSELQRVFTGGLHFVVWCRVRTGKFEEK